MLIISILIVLLGFFFIKIYSRHGKEYEIPVVVGMTIEETSELPNIKYFEYIILDSIFSPSKKPGEILTQDPPAESKAKKGRKIYITIASYNPENVIVPNLVDLTLRQAISQLDAVGLQGGKLTFTEDISRNAILKQTYKGKAIAKDQLITKGEMIDLLVGKGTNGDQRTAAPNVIGKTSEHARRDILSASLNVGREYFPKGSKSDMRVSKQSIAPKSSATFGGKVDLWYSPVDGTNFEKLMKEASKNDTATNDNDEEDIEEKDPDF